MVGVATPIWRTAIPMSITNRRWCISSAAGLAKGPMATMSSSSVWRSIFPEAKRAMGRLRNTKCLKNSVKQIAMRVSSRFSMTWRKLYSRVPKAAPKGEMPVTMEPVASGFTCSP